MAETVRLENKRLKWHFPNIQVPETPEALFLLGGQPMDTGAENSDPVFLKFGLARGVVELRGMAREFNYAMPECALLRLRALVGLNARAEIYAYLCTNNNGHPSGIARETGYSQKNIQDTISAMGAAHIVFPAQFIGRKKIYLVSDRQTLLYHPGNPPQWITWPPIFRALEILWTECRKLASGEMSPLMLSGRLMELAERLRPLLERKRGAIVLRPHEAFPGEAYNRVFFEDVQNWLSTTLGI
jgi:hypothetical protein